MKYLPDILKEVVSRVSDKMQKQHGFEVLFERGLYKDVSRSVYERKSKRINGQYTMIYMVMPKDEERGTTLNVEAETSYDYLIGTTTQPNWNMDKRESESFKPKLFPVYEEFLFQLSQSNHLEVTDKAMIPHRFTILPYWGGNEAGNANEENFSKDFIDALRLSNMELIVNNQSFC